MTHAGPERRNSERVSTPPEIAEAKLAFREGDTPEVKLAVLEGIGSLVDRKKAALTATTTEAPASKADLSPEQQQAQWLNELESRFNTLSKLHEGINWIDVEKALKADPESMAKLQALDAKGHQMNVFGEENDKFIFVSAWDRYEQVATDHRNITYDSKGQRLAEGKGYSPNGNAMSIIADIMGVEEDEAINYLADPRFHKQLRKAIAVNGRAWLKTDIVTRKTGKALSGYPYGINRIHAYLPYDARSFRAALRVKKMV